MTKEKTLQEAVEEYRRRKNSGEVVGIHKYKQGYIVRKGELLKDPYCVKITKKGKTVGDITKQKRQRHFV